MQINPKSAHDRMKVKEKNGQIHLIDDVIIGRNECDGKGGKQRKGWQNHNWASQSERVHLEKKRQRKTTKLKIKQIDWKYL